MLRALKERRGLNWWWTGPGITPGMVNRPWHHPRDGEPALASPQGCEPALASPQGCEPALASHQEWWTGPGIPPGMWTGPGITPGMVNRPWHYPRDVNRPWHYSKDVNRPWNHPRDGHVFFVKNELFKTNFNFRKFQSTDFWYFCVTLLFPFFHFSFFFYWFQNLRKSLLKNLSCLFSLQW